MTPFTIWVAANGVWHADRFGSVRAVRFSALQCDLTDVGRALHTFEVALTLRGTNLVVPNPLRTFPSGPLALRPVPFKSGDLIEFKVTAPQWRWKPPPNYRAVFAQIDCWTDL